MKCRRTSLFSLCILSTLCVFGCDSEESQPETKSCNRTADCGSAEEWTCNIETNTCEALNPGHCKNNVKDEDETDVDCGGSCNYKCEVGKACADNDDCSTANCNDKKVCAVKSCVADTDCVAPAVCWFDDSGKTPAEGMCISCVDGIKNGTETDIDCGGDTCAQCDKGKSCKDNRDCVTGECTNSTCTGEVPNPPSAGDLVINEVMAYPSTSKPFDNIEVSKQCDFVEIVNVSDKLVSLNTVTLKTKRIDGDAEELSYLLSGSLQPKQAAVVNACESTEFPSDVLSIPFVEDNKFNLVNSSDGYHISLLIGETEDAKVEIAAPVSSKSYNLKKDLDTSNTSLVLHNEVNPNFNQSPGRCSNNQPFSTGCVEPCANGKKDNDETDIDCGGSCGKCVNDKACNSGADCLTGICESGKCTGEMPKTPVVGDLVINEVMSNAATGKPFDNTDIAKQCDFVEIVNTSASAVLLDNVTLKTNRIGGNEDEENYELSGKLDSKQAAVFHDCEGNFPNDILAVNNGFTLVNSADGYKVSLIFGETDELASVTLGESKQGTSFNLTSDLDTTNSELVLHSEVSSSGLNYSPGRCTNGASFANNCVDTCHNDSKDGNESDVDCGGSCAPCETDKTCNQDSDCSSGVCSNNKCASTCNNQKLDGNETDVDCGGSCAPCEEDKACLNNGDCMSNYCSEEKCTACSNDDVCGPGAFCTSGSCVMCDAPAKGELVINEVLGKLSSPNNGMVNCSGCEKEVEFIELYNNSSKRLNLSALTVKAIKEEDGVERVIPLANVPGCLAAEHYLVLTSKEIVLDDAKSVTFKHSDVSLNDGKAYNIMIYNSDETTVHEAYMPAHNEAGVSLARTGGIYDDDTALITLKPHNTLTYYNMKVLENSSPGLDNFINAVPAE